MHLEWWAWIVGGIALIVAELAIPSFSSSGSALAPCSSACSCSSLPDLSLTAQLATWTFGLAGHGGALVPRLQARFPENPHRHLGWRSHRRDRPAGRRRRPFERGKVRFQRPVLGSEEWVCLADSPIAAGERVKVIGGRRQLPDRRQNLRSRMEVSPGFVRRRRPPGLCRRHHRQGRAHRAAGRGMDRRASRQVPRHAEARPQHRHPLPRQDRLPVGDQGHHPRRPGAGRSSPATTR